MLSTSIVIWGRGDDRPWRAGDHFHIESLHFRVVLPFFLFSLSLFVLIVYDDSFCFCVCGSGPGWLIVIHWDSLGALALLLSDGLFLVLVGCERLLLLLMMRMLPLSRATSESRGQQPRSIRRVRCLADWRSRITVYADAYRSCRCRR